MRDKQGEMTARRVSGGLAGRLLATSVVVMAGLAPAFAQQLPDVEVDVISTRVYTDAVDAYADGREHDARSRLARVVPSAVFTTARSAMAQWDGDTRRWRSAAVLHLDTAFRLVQRYRADAVDPHLRAADLALDRLRVIDATPDGDVFRARCVVARLHYLVVAGRHDEVDRLVAGLKVPVAVQADVLFARALSHETRARATPPRVDRRPTRATAPLQSATMAGARRVWLENHLRYATGLYEQVLALEEDAHEARLRLGRVQLERNTPDVALETLAPLLRPGCDDVVCGMAWLGKGEALEIQGDRDAAREAYLQAHAVPLVQGSATVALLTLGGDVPAAPPRTGDTAPAWRAHVLGISQRHATMIAALRAEAR